MKLYEVRRFSSENVKWATEYVKEYTKEAYTKKYRYTPEVLKLDDGRTKYTLCIKAKQVATACKYLTAYFGEEIQNLSSIVADILANDTKATHTEYTVHGDGYTCYVYVGDDAGNIHIALYLDAEASEQEDESVGETQTKTDTDSESGSKKVAERYHSKSGDTYSIITEREDGRYFVAIDCGEKGDKCGQSKIFDTYEEACRYLRSVGYSTLMKVIDVDESVGENERAETATEAETADETTAKAMVVEFCSNCETEIEMRWDVKTQGYKAYCPVCGEVLMLCSECVYRSGDFFDDCDFDGRDGSCRFNPKVNPQDSNKAHCLLLYDWILPDDECYQIMTDGTRTYNCQYKIEVGTCKLLSRNNTRKGGGA